MFKLHIYSDTDGDFRIDINLSTKADFNLIKEEHKNKSIPRKEIS